METFVQKHARDVTGVINGFDRLVFRGTLRRLAYRDGMMAYLWAAGVLLKDFARHVMSVSTRLKKESQALGSRAGRPVEYLASSRTDKEQAARKIAQRDSIQEGLICILSCVEPCWSFDIYRNRESKRLELVNRRRKCLHFYHYYIHPDLGFMNARIQSWFPFSIQVCINGRQWLSRQMDKTGVAYQRRDNCFTWIEDVQRAQDLMDNQLRTSWPSLLTDIARTLNPAHEEIFKDFPADYYWTAYQSEWATDIMFRSPKELARLYPSLVYHAMATFSSPDVMRFLGRRVPVQGTIPHAFAGEVVSDLKHRPEGIRVKHRVKSNSIKMYDKQGSNLRIETTINDPSDFKVYRKSQSDKQGKLDWLPMRKGIADLHRRAEISQACNNRYLEALASAQNTTPLKEWTDKLCRPVTWNGNRVRALNPYSPEEIHLLQTISRGEFTINGFRNKDIRTLLYNQKSPDNKQQRRQSAAITRKFRLLRAHGLIKKVPKTHRYHLTAKGRLAITALLAARNSDTDSLTKLAA
ncbi:hypothetical protein ACFL2Q_08495 [Thermodesulfobacteriota bacterium]